MDGLTLLNELRERKSPVRAIIVSAYGDMTNLRTAMNRGAFDFVTKPVDSATRNHYPQDGRRLPSCARSSAPEAAERARSNLSRYFSPNIVEMLAARTNRSERCGARRSRCCSSTSSASPGWPSYWSRRGGYDAAGFPRADDGADLRLRRHCREIVGNAIFAVFGVPTATSDDAANALICADMMLEALARWNNKRKTRGEAPLAIGIGLNYGPAVLGDVGSEHSMSFTVIGDTVNTASAIAGIDPDPQNTPGRRRSGRQGGSGAASGSRRQARRTPGRSGRAYLARQGRPGASLDTQDERRPAPSSPILGDVSRHPPISR